MAGSITVTQAQATGPFGAIPGFMRTVIAWTSDASGNVNGQQTPMISGTICAVEFMPNTGGTAPTDLYDMTIADFAGVDILSGKGANLSATVPSVVTPSIPMGDGTTVSTCLRVISDILTPNIQNAGNAKGGQIIIYTR